MATKKKGKYYTRPDGLKEAIRTINGKRVAFRGKTDREVDRKILEYKEGTTRGRKFPVIADEWERLHETTGISEGTRKAAARTVKRLKAAFPSYVKDIRPVDVWRYIKQFETKGYSASYVAGELSVLRRIFSHAVIAGDIDASPAAEVQKSKGLPAGTRKALTPEQEKAVMTCRKGDWWLLGMFLMFTGCRIGELLALRWEDIDRAADVIHITKKLNYAYGNTPKLENHLKSANGTRDIPLLDPLRNVLPHDRIGLIFPGKGGEPLTAHRKRKAWAAYCRDVGFVETVIQSDGTTAEFFPVTPHCFRHSFATICYEAGVDAWSAAAMLGDTREVLEKVYQELRDDHKRAAASKLEDYARERMAR